MTRLCWKAIWFAYNRGYRGLLFLFYKMTEGSFFRKIGRGVVFYGHPGFGSVEGNISLGRKTWVGKRVFFSCSRGAEIVIGDLCSMNTGCHLVAMSGIRIGNGVRIGEYVSIRDQNHAFEEVEATILEQGFSAGAITIGDDCWIGRGVFIGAGVCLGRGCVVGANSVVTQSFEANSVIAGSPARLIRRRGDRSAPSAATD